MWGDGGRTYWRKREEGGGGGETAGIVVMYAWLSSQERQVKSFVDLYASLGWSTLICHSDFLTLFFPETATRLARTVLHELIEEIKIRPLPIVFAGFSGGPKGCMYKVLQLMDGKYIGRQSLAECKLVKDCVCGQIYDSPVDFTSHFGTRFVLHPSVIKMSRPPRALSWMASMITSGLDTLFLNKFEEQRADFWQTLYSSVAIGPFLMFCSDSDELAPYPVIANFAQRLQELGGDVRIVKWKDSPHVGHYKHNAAEYKAAVTELLSKAALIYSQRRQVNGEPSGTASSCKVSKSVWDLHKAAVNSNDSLKRVAASPSDHFFLPSSVEYEGTRDAVSMQGEHKPDLICLQSTPVINANGVLGKILFDVCVPKDLEGWDIKPVSMNSRQTLFPTTQRGPSNPIKCIRRSKL